MGVERFFSSVKKEFDIIKNTTYPYQKINGKYLLIDFNSIVHIISGHMISTVNNSIKQQIKSPYDFNTINTFENNMLINIKKYLIDLIKENTVKENLKVILLAIDGVPTIAKIKESKGRRYMGNLQSYLTRKFPDPFKWPNTNISPGTNFMKKLQDTLKSVELSLQLKKICPQLDNFIVSDTTEPGEGEMKIINFIKKQNIDHKDNIIVYSPDSDMIILLMMLDHKLTLLRYDQQKSKLDSDFNGKLYNILDVNNFSNILLEHIKSKVKYFTFEKRNIINDIVFLLTIFGDDFLPKLEPLTVSSDIFILIDYYIVNNINYGYLLEKINNIYSLRTVPFLNFLKLLEKQELLFLKRNANENLYSNFYRIEKEIFSTEMYKFRDMFSEYLWKFIYLNKKDTNECASINPNNITKCYNINQFETFFKNKEDKIDNKILENFAKRKFIYSHLNILSKMKEIFKNNYLNIIKFIKHKDLYFFILNNKLVKDRELIFKKNMELYYLIDTKDNLFTDFIFMMFSTFELPLKISLFQNHRPLQKHNYDSNDKYHSMKLDKLHHKDALNYKINYKIDEYFNILNPKDKFYSKYFNDNLPDKNELDNYYKIHFDNTIKNVVDNVVDNYLQGLNWVLNYYFNHIIDKLWLYPYGKSPLIIDIINNYDTEILKLVKKDKYSDNEFMTQLEQIIFISPIDLNKDIINQIQFVNQILPREDIQKIAHFIKNNKEYFFPLSDIYSALEKEKIIDCTTSVFVNKCHLIFLERKIDINKYLEDFRKVLPLEYQRRFYKINL